METSSRRKACKKGNTCYAKKIKCDMVKPVCSNCQLYKVQCTTTVVRRRTIPPKERSIGATPQHNESFSNETIEARLARIESKLDSISGSNNVSLEGSMGLPPPVATTHSSDLLQTSVDGSDYLTPDSTDESKSATVPSLHEILPAIDAFFRDFNSVMPLFHQASFMKLLHDFYSGTTRRSKVSWGVINCVLALGSRMLAIEAGPVQYDFSESKSNKYMSNALKCLDDFMMRNEDTLGIQGILVLVFLHQASPNSRPAFLLVGSAIRLAHQLQLHTRSSHANFSPDESRQRDNIFWICYLLDKYLSSRNKVPSIQKDEDLDIDLPPEEGDGLLTSVNGLSKFNYFRARVQLAHLQGKIFDTLYTVRSKKSTPEERQRHVVQLDMMLDKWHRSIPTPLRIENMAQSLDRGAVVHMIILQHTYLLSLVFLHGLYSLKSEWVQALGSFGQTVLANMDNNTDICMRHMQPPLPSAWSRCVTASRCSMQLFLAEPLKTCCLWLNMGAYFSEIIILLANCQYYPNDESARQDHKLAKDGIALLSNLVHLKQDGEIGQVMCVINDMEIIVDNAINHYQGDPDIVPRPPSLAQESYLLSDDFFSVDLMVDHATDADAPIPGNTPQRPNSAQQPFDFSDIPSANTYSFNEKLIASFDDGSFQDIF